MRSGVLSFGRRAWESCRTAAVAREEAGERGDAAEDTEVGEAALVATLRERRLFANGL